MEIKNSAEAGTYEVSGRSVHPLRIHRNMEREDRNSKFYVIWELEPVCFLILKRKWLHMTRGPGTFGKLKLGLQIIARCDAVTV